jgi:hypothetical protein
MGAQQKDPITWTMGEHQKNASANRIKPKTPPAKQARQNTAPDPCHPDACTKHLLRIVIVQLAPFKHPVHRRGKTINVNIKITFVTLNSILRRCAGQHEFILEPQHFSHVVEMKPRSLCRWWIDLKDTAGSILPENQVCKACAMNTDYIAGSRKHLLLLLNAAITRLNDLEAKSLGHLPYRIKIADAPTIPRLTN